MKHTYKQTMIACYLGYISQAIVNNLAPILFIVFQNSFHISFEMIGRLILINFGTQLVTDAVAAKYADRIGYRRAAVAAHALCALGLVALGILPNLMPSPYTGLVIAVMIYAVGGGLIEVLISPIVDSLPGDAKASAMSLLHSFYCWGQFAVVLITTLLLKLLGSGVWYLLPLVWAILPLVNMFNFMRVPLMPTVAEHERLPFRQLATSKLFVLVLVLMMCAGASEQAMAQWSSLFAEKGLKVPKVLGDLLGPCLFAILMGTGRSIYGFLGHRINLRKALMASAAFCILCYSVTVFVHIPVLSLMGCAMCGLAVSLMWPGIFSMTAERYPKGGTMMFGMLAIMGDLGCALGPWIAGLVSDLSQKSQGLLAIGAANGLEPDQLGLKTGILAAIVFPIIMLIGVATMKKDKKAAESGQAA